MMKNNSAQRQVQALPTEVGTRVEKLQVDAWLDRAGVHMKARLQEQPGPACIDCECFRFCRLEYGATSSDYACWGFVPVGFSQPPTQ